jgi:hypothetical protein
MEHEERKWWRPSDLEEVLGMSKSRQARLRCEGKLSYHKIGSYVYYSKDVINQMIEDAKVC